MFFKFNSKLNGLFIYSLQITSLFSILQRISGVFCFFYLFYVCVKSVIFVCFFWVLLNEGSLLNFLMFFLILFFVGYHFLNGVRVFYLFFFYFNIKFYRMVGSNLIQVILNLIIKNKNFKNFLWLKRYIDFYIDLNIRIKNFFVSGGYSFILGYGFLYLIGLFTLILLNTGSIV